jgi:NADPH:quinone reductase-like Zn-dependent oxidoreductase
LNIAKPVIPPGPHQILCRVEAVGLCFSDLKLLKQFSSHARDKIMEAFNYTSIMAPVPDLVAASVQNAAKGGMINIFAGIPEVAEYLNNGLWTSKAEKKLLEKCQ